MQLNQYVYYRAFFITFLCVFLLSPQVHAQMGIHCKKLLSSLLSFSQNRFQNPKKIIKQADKENVSLAIRTSSFEQGVKSGDFYKLIRWKHSRKWSVLVGDAAGHENNKAARRTMQLHQFLNRERSTPDSANGLLKWIDANETPRSRMMALSHLMFHPQRNLMEYAVAADITILLKRKSSGYTEVKELKNHGTFLMGEKGAGDFSQTNPPMRKSVSLNAGDQIFIMTDGVLDHLSESRGMSLKKLQKWIKHLNMDVHSITDQIWKNLPQGEDERTFVALEWPSSE